MLGLQRCLNLDSNEMRIPPNSRQGSAQPLAAQLRPGVILVHVYNVYYAWTLTFLSRSMDQYSLSFSSPNLRISIN